MREKIIDRVRKLLALSTSSNVHEAAAAAGRAQDLIERHALRDEEIEDESPEARAERAGYTTYVLETTGRVTEWRLVLAQGICHVNGCTLLTWREGPRRRRKTKIVAAGSPRDLSAIAYLYEYFRVEIERLATAVRAKRYGVERTYMSSFRLGASVTIREKMEAARNAVHNELRLTGDATAIARIDKRLARLDDVKAWADDFFQAKEARDAQGKIDPEGYAAGRRAARAITVPTAETPRLGEPDGDA